MKRGPDKKVRNKTICKKLYVFSANLTPQLSLSMIVMPMAFDGGGTCSRSR